MTHPHIFTCGEASRSMDDVRTPVILEMLADRGKRDMLAYVIEVSELNSEVRFDLRGPGSRLWPFKVDKRKVLTNIEIIGICTNLAL